ncbi:MAG: nicotinate-nucleotide adenylyltransferase [Candidatus Saganbacteria bacterium]|nr:nicotinate-nucleotide adenylyltransferase [Candidatus Saganbacteria bacterium]
MKRVGILGGTFNPVHNGHIALAKKAVKEFGLETVIFVPTGFPPHKSDKDLAPKQARMKMVRLALKGRKKFTVSRIEIDRKGYSYAIDTFKKLKRRFGSETKLFYIMGLDSINSILSWKKPLELFKLCQFLIATRPGSKLRTFRRIMKFPPISINKDKVELFELKMDLSSSDIRERMKKGKNIDRMIPKAVLRYINKKGLYR